MKKHPEQRIGVFVDVSNMYHSAKNFYNANVNFGKLLETAIGERKLIRAIAYVIRSQSQEEEGFFGALEKQGFEVKWKDLQIFITGEKKADWDVGIAIDTIKFIHKLDVIVLVSGDGDYIPLVQYLQSNGCIVEVMAFGKTASRMLREVADDFIDLGSDEKRFLFRTDKKAKKMVNNVTPKVEKLPDGRKRFVVK